MTKKLPVTYELQKKSGKARAGKITTPHGEIETPVFMPWLLYTSDAADDTCCV